jgi:heptaprenyl diphosphate synthase
MALSTLQRREKTSPPIEQRRTAASGLTGIFRRAGIADDLTAVERRLLERTTSRSTLLAESGAYTVAAGGKRLRAALVLLAARLGTYQFERAMHPAVAVELLHGASLIHDDLVDHADRRRGRVTVHTRWDNGVALMLGDYFFALSADELSAEPDPRIIRFYADAAHTVVEGELSPVTRLEPFSAAMDQYIYKIGSKTAALFVAACKAGMAVAGGTPEQIEALGRFGYDLGLAFQIVDDVLDFVGDEATLGKPAGNDLREGTWTLPLLYAVDSSDDPLLRALVQTGHVDPDQVPYLVDLVVQSGGVARAMSEARYIADRALRHLDIFPPSPTKRAFADICEFVLARHS